MQTTEVIAYIRVSTVKQGESGFGADLQQHIIESFARENGLTIRKTLTESASASGPNSIRKRAVLRDAIEEAERTACPIIVARLDRLSRHVDTIRELMRNERLSLIFTDLGIYKPLEIVVPAAAGAERHIELLKARTRKALASIKASGKLLGNRTNLDEAQRKGCASNARRAIERLAHHRAAIEAANRAGAVTSKAVADRLNAVRHPNAHGVPWTACNVRQVLSRIKKSDQRTAHCSASALSPLPITKLKTPRMPASKLGQKTPASLDIF